MSTEEPVPGSHTTMLGALPHKERMRNRTVRPGQAVQATEAPRLPPEASLIQAQWERAQKDLERTQVLHQREAEQSKAKLERLHEALEAAAHAGPEEGDHSARNKALAGVGMALLMVGAVLGIAKYMHNDWNAAPVEAARSSSEPAAVMETAAVGEFSQGIERLSRAFNRFPGVDPETIMRKVNKKAAASGTSVCAFAWNDGQPALQLGLGHGGTTSLAGSISQCADAVERF